MITPIKILISLFLLIPALSYGLPPEFTATYSAHTYGMTVAQATYNLKHSNNGLKFTQHSKPSGFATFFTDDELYETSLLSMHNGQLLLNEYSYTQKGSKYNKNINLKINWNDSDDKNITGNASGTVEGEPVQININAPVWDTLSFQIPIMMNYDESITEPKHSVLVKGKLKTYLFTAHGTETVSINDRVFNTMKVETKSVDNDKPLFLWIAPKLNNIPVKIEKWKKGKPHITMLLNSATFPSNKDLRFEPEENFEDFDDL